MVKVTKEWPSGNRHDCEIRLLCKRSDKGWEGCVIGRGAAAPIVLPRPTDRTKSVPTTGEYT